MPDPDLNPPGLFGKLPSTGDFVTRGLPAGFLRVWDAWLSRHLAARLDRPLRFLIAARGAMAGPMTGVVLPSADRAGRRYPLTLAAAARAPAAPGWYEALEALGAAAMAEGLTADALHRRLAAHAIAAGAGDPPPLLLWTGTPLPVDPETPDPVLDHLLGAA